MPKTVAIMQPNYLPWQGYVDLMNRVDEFIIYDDTQYTRRDWRNRNRIMLAGKQQWLSIPVEVSGRYEQAICDVRIADTAWQKAHPATLRHAYAKAPYFEDVCDLLALGFEGRRYQWLLDADVAFIELIRGYLSIQTRLTFASDYKAEGRKTEKLIALCAAAGADHYISAPAAKAYIEPDLFQQAGIQLSYIDYPTYPEYAHVSTYAPSLSVIDALMHCGQSAAHHFTPAPKAAAA
ncbi:MAG: WbqC family protein [Pseudomonadota bacterium]